MTPINYVSKKEAIEMIAAAKFAGMQNCHVVIDLRQKGIDVT